MFDDDRDYQVVRNLEDQFSIWPVGLAIPAGWVPAGPSGPRATCLSFIKETWTDMRPRSLREAMEANR